MKELIAVVAVIILGIAVGGVIVGLSAQADSIEADSAALTTGLVDQYKADVAPAGTGD